MSVARAASRLLSLLVFILPAPAQWDDSDLAHTLTHVGRDLSPDPIPDVEGERPHTVFERLERTMSQPRTTSDRNLAAAPGTVSVAELRHPLSQREESLIQRVQRFSVAGE